MSAPFEHLHADLAGPFPVHEVTAAASSHRRAGATSTTQAGSAYVLLVVDYFTKAAEIAYLADKRATTTARAFHDQWILRYGVPVCVTTDNYNGQEFAGAFRHQLEPLQRRDLIRNKQL